MARGLELARRAVTALPDAGGGAAGRCSARTGPRRSAAGPELPALELAVPRGGRRPRRTWPTTTGSAGSGSPTGCRATYPHVWRFPLALRLMTAPDVPAPADRRWCTSATGSPCTARSPPTRPSTSRTYAENLRPHDRGRQVDVVLVGSVDGEEVWRGVSTYLGRERKPGGGERRDRGTRPRRRPATARWRVEPRVGTEYARVSGDHNPIHTSRLGARLFGFRAADRARHVEQGALPGRAGGPAAGRVHRRGRLQAARAAAEHGGLRAPAGRRVRPARLARPTAPGGPRALSAPLPCADSRRLAGGTSHALSCSHIEMFSE